MAPQQSRSASSTARPSAGAASAGAGAAAAVATATAAMRGRWLAAFWLSYIERVVTINPRVRVVRAAPLPAHGPRGRR